VALTEAEFAILDKTGEAPPTTREAMFALMRDRLDDINDLFLQDTGRALMRLKWRQAPRSGFTACRNSSAEPIRCASSMAGRKAAFPLAISPSRRFGTPLMTAPR
jgi:hypothetical protein